MNINMKMPDLATNEGAELGVSRWLVEVGQAVARGQPLLEVETDKAVQEVECIASGILKTIHVQCGQRVQVGAIIATITVS
jgi:pyruvate dehydrogenase E2 component (dihydrolipoamide acetyltransferase)